MEHVEQISLQVQQLKKKLAWSWVYDADKKLEEQNLKIEKLKSRVPTCQAKIDKQLVCMPILSSHSEVFIGQLNVKFSLWFKNITLLTVLETRYQDSHWEFARVSVFSAHFDKNRPF